MNLLETRGVSKYFGGVAALEEVTLEVREGEILGVVGPNGAGKSTLFNVITGLMPATRGDVIFRNERITRLRTDQIAARGIGRTFQASVLFMDVTVLQNVHNAFYLHYREPGWKAFFHTRAARIEETAIGQRADEILRFVGLHGVRDELALNLPHGHQRLLGIALVLAAGPRLLLLDEPMTGMNPVETAGMIDFVRRLRDDGHTIVLVEHDMKAVMSLSDRIVVLARGTKITEGTPEEIRHNDEVIEAYLGKGNPFDAA